MIESRAKGSADDFDVQVAQEGVASGTVSGFAGQMPAPPTADRLVARTGEIRLQTGNPAEVGQRAVEAVKAAGGWVVRRQDDTYVFRIPADRFEEMFHAIEEMGAVVSRRVDAEDVTEEVRDLELRLKNARALRDRYAELLKRADKVEDVLAIERELAKVTEEIERMETQLKTRSQDVAFSRLTLVLLPVRPSRVIGSKSPFPWVSRVGVENLPTYRSDRASASRVRWELPADFADMGRVSASDILGWAYSPDGIRIVVRRFERRPAGDAAFWKKELSRELVKARGYEAQEAPGEVLMFRTIADGQPTTYAIRLVVTERYLTATEVIGPADVIAAEWPRIAAILDRIEAEAR
ncbi:MAG: DUF4349 domain-containing protein [Planctomycetota bacterium]